MAGREPTPLEVHKALADDTRFEMSSTLTAGTFCGAMVAQVDTLATFDAKTSPRAVGKSLASAPALP